MPLITFQPGGKSVSVPVGTGLIDAAAKAGVEIVAPCGTKGNCGKCVVRVLSGAIEPGGTSILSASALNAGYIQACQATVGQDPLVIDVPPQRIRSGQFADIALDLDRIEPELLPQPSDLNPLTVTCQLQLPDMAEEGDLSDAEHLSMALQKQWGSCNVTYALTALRQMAVALREDDGRVTIKLRRVSEAYHVIDIRSGHIGEHQYGLAVDIGTTTISVQLVSLVQGDVIDTRTGYNGQIACGLDVISRINYAGKPENLLRLTEQVVGTINELIEQVTHENRVDAAGVVNMTLSGNTTMTHLLLGLPPEYIRLSPYTPTILEPPVFTASDVGLAVHPEASVYLAPAVGSYIGGDITAGLLCTSISQEADEMAMFIDIGTNGELVIGNGDFILACACSAGPAFEGGGIRSGMRASRGAVESVVVDPASGIASAKTVGDVTPQGICGSGIISLLAELFRTGWLDPAGKLNRESVTPAIRIGKKQAVYIISETGEGGGEISISEAEIENVIRAKAAIYSAISLLMEQAEIGLDDIGRVYIAGGFGHFLNLEDAVCIGLLPDIPREKYRYIGNASLMGSTMALVSKGFQQKQLEIGRRITYVELSTDPAYMNQYTAALFLPHTDLTAFPSVRAPK